MVRQQLADYKEIKDALGGTVNDVVLTVVSGALAPVAAFARRAHRGPGDARAGAGLGADRRTQRGSLGNQLTAMRGPLPGLHRGPGRRGCASSAPRWTASRSQSRRSAPPRSAAVNNLAPPTILAQASRLNFSTRLFNLLVTNIPGPQLPLYVLGRELQDLFPVAFLPEDHALAVAIMSYNGGLDYGLLGDYDAMPDIEVVADGIEASLAELLAAARGRRGEAGGVARTRSRPTASGTAPADTPAVEDGEPAPIIPADHARRTKRGPAADMRAKRERGSRPARKRTSD